MGPFKVLDFRLSDTPLEFRFGSVYSLQEYLITSYTLGTSDRSEAISEASTLMNIIYSTRGSAADGVHQRLLDEVIALLAEASIDVQVLPTEE